MKKNQPQKNNSKNWHQKHRESLTLGQRVADKLAARMGSWGFIFIQSAIVVIWMILNIIGYLSHWDPYPFVLLNLLFSTQAAYAAPIIMMAQNRQNERDRIHANEDYMTDIKAKKEIEELQLAIMRIENEKIDLIIEKLKRLEKNNSQ